LSNIQDNKAQRYFQLATIVVAAGAIYPLLYLRQNFELSILDSFSISLSQLSQCYAMLGVTFVLTYLPSGWLADRISPRILLTFSLATTGFVGLWFSTTPSFAELQVIFVSWGVGTGLTFWSAHIKAVTLLANHDEQGRFFGILDGGRGLFEALLATVAIGWFAYSMETQQGSTSEALQKVIYLYVGVLLLLAPIVFFVLDDPVESKLPNKSGETESITADLKLLLSRKEIWFCAVIILCGYQMFWATYSFSGYLQNTFGMTAVAVGSITVAKLWMRPIGAATAGFVGDFFNREHVIMVLLVLSALSLGALSFLPSSASSFLLMTLILFVGILTYAVRGIYWATLESCDVPDRIKGLAIGVISLIGYFPDIYLPLINAALLQAYPGRTGYTIYFIGIAIMGLVGATTAWQLRRTVQAKTNVTGI
jgi:nitrate/nitrite transporter NarK